MSMQLVYLLIILGGIGVIVVIWALLLRSERRQERRKESDEIYDDVGLSKRSTPKDSSIDDVF